MKTFEEIKDGDILYSPCIIGDSAKIREYKNYRIIPDLHDPIAYIIRHQHGQSFQIKDIWDGKNYHSNYVSIRVHNRDFYDTMIFSDKDECIKYCNEQLNKKILDEIELVENIIKAADKRIKKLKANILK